jgi:D-inositol-3-phosphate glycosyltransferase
MHTMAKVKNDAMAVGDTPEPPARIIGEEQVVEAADMLIASTDLEAKELIELYDADPARVEVVHPGVDLDLFRPGDQSLSRAALGIAQDAVVLAFVGRIQPLKAPDVLLRAAARLRELDPDVAATLTVVIVGGNSGSGLDLAALAGQLGLGASVRFLPPQRGDALADVYRAADIVAVPSYNESFGLVAVESMACGTPVVATRAGGIPEAISDGETGLLVPPHDEEALAQAIVRLLRDPELRQRIGSAGQQRVANEFSVDRMVERTLSVYEERIHGSIASTLPPPSC